MPRYYTYIKISDSIFMSHDKLHQKCMWSSKDESKQGNHEEG